MKYLVVGLGKSGIAAYNLLAEEGHAVVGVDDNKELLEKLSREGKNVDPEPRVENFDCIIVSPGIPPKNRFYAQALQLRKKIWGEAQLAFSRLHQPIVAITGTNGKTTVTLLIEHVLKTAGLRARALGNVGTPLTSYVKEADPQEIIVAEVSSYQLETLEARAFDIGILLNITPDHLDRYSSMTEYAMAKCRLQDLIKPTGAFFVHQTVVHEFKSLLKRDYQTYGTTSHSTYWTDRSTLRKGERVEAILPIRYREWGDHESENVLAAWIVCQTFGIDEKAFLNAVNVFKKPSHRIEFVASINGVGYFDDSKGTNIDATMKAVEAMNGKVVLIAGGVDKGSSYQPWKTVFAGKVKQIIAIGQAAPKIAAELQDEFIVEIVPSLQAAVQRARQIAVQGESVLLSPGCSSYDMFRDYAHRGDKFKEYVLEERRN